MIITSKPTALRSTAMNCKYNYFVNLHISLFSCCILFDVIQINVVLSFIFKQPERERLNYLHPDLEFEGRCEETISTFMGHKGTTLEQAC